MADATNQVVQNSSTPAPTNPVTGTNDANVSTSGGTPTSTPVVARKGLRQALQEMLQGWQTAVPTGSTMSSSDGTLVQGAVLGQLQAYLGVYTTLDAQATSLKQTRLQLATKIAEARQYYDVLKAAVINSFGPRNPQLAQFGLQPKKTRKPLSGSQRAIKAAKAKITRQLRGTVSKAEKAKRKSGPMDFIEPVQHGAQGSAPTGTTAASAALVEPTMNAASPPGR